MPGGLSALRDEIYADADRVRAALQGSASPSLKRRRRIAVLSAIALADAALMALHQIGAIQRLPDLPGKMFQANRVTTSKPGFPFGVPDSAIAAVLYSLNLIAASAGGTRRTGRARIWSLLLGGSALGTVLGTAVNLWVMVARQKRICLYCLLAAAMNLAIAPLAVAEAVADLRDR